jgi:hypothetical protein
MLLAMFKPIVVGSIECCVFIAETHTGKYCLFVRNPVIFRDVECKIEYCVCNKAAVILKALTSLIFLQVLTNMD